MFKNKGHESAEIFNRDWFEFLSSGSYLSIVSSEELLIHLSKINRLSDFMYEHEKEIDKIFARGFS